MADITKTYVQGSTAFRFIGKTYGDSDRVNGGFSAQWGEAFETGLFERLKELSDEKLFEDADAYIGLMRARTASRLCMPSACSARRTLPYRRIWMVTIFQPLGLGSAGFMARSRSCTAGSLKWRSSWMRRDTRFRQTKRAHAGFLSATPVPVLPHRMSRATSRWTSVFL